MATLSEKQPEGMYRLPGPAKVFFFSFSGTFLLFVLSQAEHRNVQKEIDQKFTVIVAKYVDLRYCKDKETAEMLPQRSGQMIEEARQIAEKYLSKKGYLHSQRVAQYTEENPMIPEELKEQCAALAWIHDVWEDSGCGTEEIRALDPQKRLLRSLNLITHGKNEETYEEYIRTIKAMQKTYPEVWWVKVADMKDHLTQRETLTPRLQDKYARALAILL